MQTIAKRKKTNVGESEAVKDNKRTTTKGNNNEKKQNQYTVLMTSNA